MKKATYVVNLGIFALLMLTSCFEVDEATPAISAESVKAAVQGRWSVEKVSNKLCRDYNCNTSTVGGNPQEYFEFRLDSVIVSRVNPTANANILSAYKASYSTDGVILLSDGNRTERFQVLELKAKRAVLESTFTGRDPAAVFTDTYYLIR